MAGLNDFLAGVPTYDQIINNATTAPAAPPPGTATGTGNWLTAGLGSGLYGTLGALGQGGEAVARAVGASGVGDSLQNFAQTQRDTAATYARPDLEKGSWLDPATFGYRMAQALPTMAGVIGGGALATIGAPEEAAAGVLGAGARAMIGSTAAALPISVGENIQRAREEGQPVGQGTALKAIALGVPEAAAQAVLPAAGEGWLAGRIASKAAPLFGSPLAGRIARGAAIGGAIQMPAAVAGEALMQQMGDPNRSFADRSQALVDAALSGGITGAFYGGALHSLAKKPPSKIPNQALLESTAVADPNAGQTVSSTGVPDQARLAPPLLGLPSPDTPGLEKRLPDFSPPEQGGVPAGDVAIPPAQPGQAIRQLPAPTFEPGIRRAQSGEVITGGQIHQGEPVVPPAQAALPPPTLEGQRVGAGEVINAGDQSPPPLGLPAPTPEASDTTRRAGSGEVIQGRQLFRGEDEPAPGAPKQLTDQTVGGAQNERVSRPASDDEPVITPPPDPVRRAADTAKIIAQAKRGVAFPRLGDLVDVQSALFDHVKETLAAQKAPYKPDDVPDILGARVTKAARQAGVLDDANNVTDPWAKEEAAGTAKAEDEAAPEGTATLPEEPAEGNIPPARVQKDPNWSDARKSAFDRLEALRASIPDNLTDFHTKISDLQSQLTKPGQGGVAKIITQTKAIEEAARGQAAVDKARGEPTTTTGAPTPGADETRGAGKFEADIAQANPQSSPVEPKPKAPSVLSGALAVAKKSFVALHKNISSLMDAKLPATSDKDAGVGKRNSAYQKALTGLSNQLAKVGAAIKSGDPKALAKIGDNHFGSKLTDEFYEHADPKTQGLMDQHVQAVDDLLDKVKNAASNLHPLGSDTFSSREPTPHDQAISDLVDKGASMREILEHIAKNGSNTVRRTMAQRLLSRSKADGTVRFGSLDEAAKDHPTLRQVYGDYNGDTGETRFFDRADLEHTALHEFAHAATLKALSDPTFKGKVAKAMDAARSQMTEEEQAHPSMKNEGEFLSEAMSNPDFSSLLDGMQGPEAGRSVWQTIKSAVGRFFGWPQSAESLLDHVEHLGGEATRMVNDANTIPGIEHNIGLYARSAQDYGEQVKRAFNEKFDPKGFGANSYKHVLFWRTLNDIATGIAEHLPGGVRKVQDNTDMRNYEETMNGVLSPGDNAYRSLDRRGKALIDQLEGSTYAGIDPRRTAAQHTWLSDAERKARAPQIQAANELWNQAKRNSGEVAAAYKLRNDNNRTQRLAALFALGKNTIDNGSSKMNVGDAMADFHNDLSGRKNDPSKSADWWHGKVTDLKAQVDKYVAQKRADISTATTEAKKQELRDHIATMEDWSQDTARHLLDMDRAPNFALRRQGDHFAAGKILNRSAETIQKLADIFKAAGHGDVMLDHNVGNDQVYIRTQGFTRAQALKDAFNKAAEAGLIEKGSVKANLAASLQSYAGLPKYVRAQLKAFDDFMPEKAHEDADPNTKAAYDQARGVARDALQAQLLDLMPPSDVSKVFAERMGVQGASTDMGKAYLDRGTNTSRMIAQLSKMRDMSATNQAIRDQVRAATENPNMSVAQAGKIKMAANEMFMRDAQRQWKLEKSPFDGIRKMTHFFELGLSVPYAMALQAQTWTLGHAELTKHFGAFASAKSLMGNALPTLDVLKRTFSNGQKNNLLKDLVTPGSDRWGFLMTGDKLKGLKQQRIDDLLKLNNMGAFNTSQTQWVYDGLHHHEGAMRQLHDIAGASTLYSEMNPRVNVGLSAIDMYRERAAQGKQPRGKEWNDEYTFAKHVIEQSQQNWSPDNQPRAFGKQGVAGGASPLVSQFQGFRGKMLEKMHREFADAMGARGPEYKKQAQKFLLTHIAAQTALAGTMGLPAVSMLSGLYDKLADAFTGDHTHDIRASYRGWLSNVFGNTAGEVLAHGAPRLGGVDLSEHLGEDRLLPLTDLMTNKRKLEDAYGDWLQQAVGSSARMAYHMAKGARDMSNGDYLKGAAAFMPEMIKNALEAEQVGQYGYTDKSGFAYPGGPPSGKDIAVKALGLTPSDEANYEEKEKIVEGQEARQDYDKTNIMTHLAKSFNRQDPQAYQDWVMHSQNYMATHPGLMPPAAEFGNFLQEHMRAAALAGSTGTPLSTNVRDLISRGMVSYGNAGDQ